MRAGLERLAFWSSLLAILTACGASIDLLTEALPTKAIAATNAAAWQEIAPGLEWRTIVPDGDELAQLKVVRIDSEQYRFRALYRPGQALSLRQWRSLEPGASVIVNANFFNPDYRALGLVVSDGAVFGSPYRDRGGTLIVKDDEVSIRSFRSGLPQQIQGINQAIQGFPLLVENGAQAFFDSSSARRARRTVVAQDTSGRILILVTPFLGMSLVELSAFLPSTDLDIVTAMNLDGGGSTMLFVNEIDYQLPSFDALPTALAIYRR